MVGTITPVVYGSGSRSSWCWIICIYTVSQIAGAAVTVFVLATVGLLGKLIYAWSTTTLAAAICMICAIGALQDLKLIRYSLPSRCWQVPQRWKRFSPRVMASCYGFGIGLGVITRIPYASFYLVLVACAGLASVPHAVGLMSLYGVTRAATMAFAASGQASVPDPTARLMAIVRLSPLVGYGDGLALAVVAGLMLSQSVLSHL
jgi:hypothetical protein